MNISSIFQLIFILSFFTINAQNYIQYYQLVNEGDSLKYLKKYSEALYKYEKAFSKVDFIHSDILTKAGIVAIKVKKYEEAEKYFEKAIAQSGNYDFEKHKEFKKNKRKFENLINKLPELDSTFILNINIEYKRLVDSLYEEDQRIRKSKIINYEKKDESIFSSLLDLVSLYGFPSEKIVGKSTYNRANILLHHNLRKVENEKLLEEYFNKYVLTGEYRPEDYAWTFEQNKVWYNNESPKYYFQIISTKNLSIVETKEINNLRKEIGLKPISAYKSTKNSSVLLWR